MGPWERRPDSGQTDVNHGRKNIGPEIIALGHILIEERRRSAKAPRAGPGDRERSLFSEQRKCTG
jgi:hypothetical protein